VLGAIGLVIAGVGIPLALLGDWADALKISAPALRAEAGRALAIVVAACALGVPLNAVARLSAAVQRGWLQAGWVAAGSAATLAAVAFAAWARWNFLGFLAVATLVPVFQGAALLAHLERVLRWKAAPGPLLPAESARSMLGSSLLYAPPQLGLAILQAAPAFVITHAAGPAAVTSFALLVRLFSPLQQGQVLLLTPFWPAYTEAHVRGDHGWLRGAFRGSLIATAALVGGLCIIALKAGTLIRLWVHQPDAAPPIALVWATAAWCSVQMVQQPFQYLLVGVGRMRTLAFWGTLGPAAALGCMAALGARFGATGVTAGGAVGLAIAALPGLIAGSRSILRRGNAGRQP
jgi:O-antigen/teichoic acid export membrane protein